MTGKNKLRLALLAGGRSAEREVSLAGARVVSAALDPERYHVRMYDPATDLERLVHDSSQIDAAFILLHGRFGEDGTIQGLLDLLDIPYQGSGVLGSALAMDKHLSKVIYREAGIPTPAWLLTEKDSPLTHEEIRQRLGLPVMVKPATQGSSVGITKVSSPEDVTRALEKAFSFDPRVVVEAFVPGREITGGILGTRPPTPLPLVEITPGEGFTFFDYEAKYRHGASRETCPADLTPDITHKAQGLALAAHKALQLTGYSRTDMILSPAGGLFVLETNTIPGMTETSLFPLAARAAGITFGELLDQLIEMALEGRS
ncbi:MAG: D-alanine--D-alanine ligase [Deltaproteobacteria bacterium]